MVALQVLSADETPDQSWSSAALIPLMLNVSSLVMVLQLTKTLHLEFGGQTLHSWLVPKHTTKHPIQFILVVRKIPREIPELQLANNGANCKKGWQTRQNGAIFILPAKLVDQNFITSKPQKRNMLFTPVPRWLSVTAEETWKNHPASILYYGTIRSTWCRFKQLWRSRCVP